MKNKILGSARDHYTDRQEKYLIASKAQKRERQTEPVIDAPIG